MSNSAALSESEVKRFVDLWYHSLDIHVSLETFLAMVTAEESIEFRFPEVTVTDIAGLTDWYKRVTTSFFDEIHQTVKVAISVDDDGKSAAVKLVTHWQASTWDPPAAKSERINFLAGQTWKVKRSTKNGQLVVVDYIVDTFDPVGGSNSLPVKDTAKA